MPTVSIQHELIYPNEFIRRRVSKTDTLTRSKENDRKLKTVSQGLFNKDIPVTSQSTKPKEYVLNMLKLSMINISVTA